MPFTFTVMTLLVMLRFISTTLFCVLFIWSLFFLIFPLSIVLIVFLISLSINLEVKYSTFNCNFEFRHTNLKNVSTFLHCNTKTSKAFDFNHPHSSFLILSILIPLWAPGWAAAGLYDSQELIAKFQKFHNSVVENY